MNLKTSLLLGIVLPATMLSAECGAAPALTVPTTANVGSNMATVVLKSSGDGTGYFTLLEGKGANCGTAAQIQAGQTSTGAMAPYYGSLPLTANTAAEYTVRNLAHDSAHTVCFTADSPTGSNLNLNPVSAGFATVANAPFFNPTWSIVGTAGFSNTTATYTSLAFAPDGTPYVAYQDSFYSGKATARKFSGGAWSVVWTGGFTAGAADYVSLAFSPGGRPNVAYRDGSTGGKLAVMENYGSWRVVGTSNYYTRSTSLGFAPDGSRNVAFVDATSSKAMLMNFAGAGSSLVGGSGFSTSTASGTSLAVAPDGTPYVAFEDGGASGKATVMKYSGGAWSVVGSAGFSSGSAYYLSLAIAPDGTPFLAYRDGGNGFRATVMKYSNGTWSPVGGAGFSADGAAYLSLAIAPDGAPYLAYQDVAYGSKATVMKYSAGSWSAVGIPGFTSQAANYISLALAPDGAPYIAFQDGINKATVMKLVESFAPSIAGTPAATATVGASYSFVPNSSLAASFGISGTLPPGLSFNAANGSLSGTPTTAGTYGGLVITATNRAGTVALPAFSVEVAPPAPPASYLLTVTTQGTGSGCVTLSTGGECVNSFGGSFPSGTSVTLSATADWKSVFSGWSGNCSGTGTCSLMMDAPQSVQANFSSTTRVKLSQASLLFASIQDAYSAAQDGEHVQMQVYAFPEQLLFNRDIAVLLEGGMDSAYSSVTGVSAVDSLKVTQGTVKMMGVVFK